MNSAQILLEIPELLEENPQRFQQNQASKFIPLRGRRSKK